jgi:hypothetical protein
MVSGFSSMTNAINICSSNTKIVGSIPTDSEVYPIQALWDKVRGMGAIAAAIVWYMEFHFILRSISITTVIG